MQSSTLFNDFYSANVEQLVRSIKRVVDLQTVAEEIAQESFSKVWQRWDDLNEPANYLYRVAFNKANDELRKRQTHRSNEHLLDLTSEQETIYLSDVLSTLNEQRRTAIYHKFYSGYTNTEVGELMDIPVGTVKSMIHRGLSEMRTQIAA